MVNGICLIKKTTCQLKMNNILKCPHFSRIETTNKEIILKLEKKISTQLYLKWKNKKTCQCALIYLFLEALTEIQTFLWLHVLQKSNRS